MTDMAHDAQQLTADEIDAVETALVAALDPNSHSNAVGCAMLVRAQYRHLSPAAQTVIEAALQSALHPTARSNAVGVAYLVRRAYNELPSAGSPSSDLG